MSNKANLVLYLDKDLVKKSKDLGFNLSKTFENHLKHLITQFLQLKPENTVDSKGTIIGKWAEPELNRRPLARKGTVLPFKNQEEMLEKFRDFQLVDLRRSKRTAYEKVWWIKRVLKFLKKNPSDVSRDDLRLFLKSLNGYSRSHYKNALMALKVFFRDFLQKPELVSSFKFPHRIFKPRQIVTKEQIRTFYKALETSKEKALFLLYATSGLRRQEILLLTPDDVDFEKRMITPSNHLGETKKSWVSFYNEETEKMLNQYLSEKKKSRSNRLFPMQRYENVKLWKTAKDKTGMTITPQKLRQWFCQEMINQGVSETYVDAFCGRVPKSVLARHYTDFSTEVLREVYEKATLEI